MKIPIAKIEFKNRARREYDVEPLMKSLATYGLFHPIVVDTDVSEEGKEYKLHAGGRRFTAAMALDWDNIEATLLGDLSPVEREEVELEENIQRKDLTWQEECQLKQRLHILKTSACTDDGKEWTQQDTAELLGESQPNTNVDLQLADGMEKYPELLEEPNKNTARTKLRRFKEAEMRKVITEESPESASEGLYNDDCRVILPTIPSNSVDLIICDPPFGIDFPDKLRNQKYHTTYGKFLDNIHEVRNMLTEIIGDLYRVLKPGGHMYLFYGVQHYNTIMQVIGEKFRYKGSSLYQSTPLLWIKSSNENMRPYHRFTMNYESFLFLWKGEGDMHELTRPHNCTFIIEPVKSDSNRHHPAQKPTELFKELIELSTHEGELVLDPFMGSGISMATALQLNRKYIGIEYLKEWADLAKWNVNRAMEET